MILQTLLLSLLLIQPSLQTPLRCAVSGPLLPRPTSLCSSPSFKSAISNLTSKLNSLVSGTIPAGFSLPNTSFAISLVSLSDPKRPVYTYTHLSPSNKQGAKKISGDSQFLIGSVSKLFTDLLLLKSGVDSRRKVTEFIPELNQTDSAIKWGDITLEDLGRHEGGIGPNYGFPEIYDLIPLYQQLGFPPVEKKDFPPCNVIGLNKACTRKQLLDGLAKARPVTAVGQRAVYSNLAFTLISFALQNATGKNYTTLLDEYIIKPLNLSNTGASPGDSEKAVIPPVDNGWGADYAFTTPGGGLYSSLNDLSTLLLSILTHSILPPSTIRKWLKPTSSTPNLQYSIGQPWEIYRTTNLTPKYPHNIDIYAKDGGAFGYVSRVGVIDQYGIGFVVLTAGDTEAMYPLAEAVVSSLVPGVEDATREEAEGYTGVFEGTEEDGAVKVGFKVDKGPGIKVLGLERNNSDILAGIEAIWKGQQVSLGPLSNDFRIYPSEIEVIEDGFVKEDWRIAMEVAGAIGSDKKSGLPSSGAFAKPCTTWQTYDLLYYGGQPVDRVVFWKNGTTGKVLGVEVPFLRGGILVREGERAVVAKMERAN